jgi:hypothetical protein
MRRTEIELQIINHIMLLMLLRGEAFKPHDEHSLKTERRNFKGSALVKYVRRLEVFFERFSNKIRSMQSHSGLLKLEMNI